MPAAIVIDTKVPALLRSRLSEGHILAKRLAQLPLDQGQVTLFVPSAVLQGESFWAESEKCASLPGFTVARIKRDEADQWFSALVLDYLHQPGQRYAIFEHSAARPGDRFLKSSRYPYFVSDSEVCYFFTSQENESENIIKARNLASSFLFTGILTTLPDGKGGILDRGTVDDGLLDELVQRTDAIFLGIHDGDAELVWSREKPS